LKDAPQPMTIESVMMKSTERFIFNSSCLSWKGRGMRVRIA